MTAACGMPERRSFAVEQTAADAKAAEVRLDAIGTTIAIDTEQLQELVQLETASEEARRAVESKLAAAASSLARP